MKPPPEAPSRSALRTLARSATGGIVSVPVAASAWRVSSREAALRLGRYARAGWITHIRRGLYHVTPLDAGPSAVIEDPWVLANTIFAPCYVGGWTAAEHWELTEQIFRSTFVFTASHVREREQTVLGAEFHLVRVPQPRLEGVAVEWRGAVRVPVSSAERTLVDGMVNPSWLGGVRQLADAFVAYKESGRASAARLSEELHRHGTGAAHKRAGWLAEHLWPNATALISRALSARTSGVIKLDPSVAQRGRMNKHWGLWVNVDISARSDRT